MVLGVKLTAAPGLVFSAARTADTVGLRQPCHGFGGVGVGNGQA
jgi:hypothetical protein